MKNILIIGAGRSSVTLITYLLDVAMENGWLITVADASPSLAKEKINGHPNGLPVWLDVTKPNDRKDLIRRVDVVVSLLPAHLHQLVAQDCLQLGKHLLTASYLSPELRQLHELARDKKLVFLGEMGLDPGIDHMSAMEKINSLKVDNATIHAFRSYAGGLIAPECDDNPWHYKVTWNPRNVVLAGRGTTQYLRDGKYKYIPYHQLFKRAQPIQIEGLGILDMYPNRDSLKYRSEYGLNSVSNLVRGTLRFPGFCQAWSAIIDLGLTEDTLPIQESSSMRYRDLMDALTDGREGTIKSRVARQLGLDEEGAVMANLIWLDLLSSKKIRTDNATPARIIEELIIDKWSMKAEDRDMVVMKHEIDYDLNGESFSWSSTMIHRGENDKHTAMTKLVGLPLAIATKLIMQRKISRYGVSIPVYPDIYQPVLKELSSFGVTFSETTREIT